MVEARIRPRGLYSLALSARTGEWRAALPNGEWAQARQGQEGVVVIRAASHEAVGRARFLLALDDDTSDFHRRFSRDPVLGPCVRSLRGLRPTRKATVTHAVIRAVCGQLIQSGKALELERAVTRACGEDPPSRDALARLSPARLTGCGLAPSRASTLVRLARTIDLEGLRASRETALARLRRERGIGPWSVGVIALSGLGRYDAGLVGDLGLVKVRAALTGRWPASSELEAETTELLAPYGEWQGLASVFLLAGLKRGLIPGASLDRARLARTRLAHRA